MTPRPPLARTPFAPRGSPTSAWSHPTRPPPGAGRVARRRAVAGLCRRALGTGAAPPRGEPPALHDLVARGEILRTHVLRPTWHFVAPQDIRWLLGLTGARIRRAMASRERDLGMDQALVHRSFDVLSLGTRRRAQPHPRRARRRPDPGRGRLARRPERPQPSRERRGARGPGLQRSAARRTAHLGPAGRAGSAHRPATTGRSRRRPGRTLLCQPRTGHTDGLRLVVGPDHRRRPARPRRARLTLRQRDARRPHVLVRAGGDGFGLDPGPRRRVGPAAAELRRVRRRLSRAPSCYCRRSSRTVPRPATTHRSAT